MGRRDKVVVLAVRSEQYLPALLFFATLGYVDLIIALRLLIDVVWVGAGVSEFGHDFSRVVAPMVSNTPTVVLFWGHPAWQGFAVTDFSSPVLLAVVAALLFFPVLANLRPDLVSFLPSLRQYAGIGHQRSGRSRRAPTMHSQGPALLSMLVKHLGEDIDHYDLREAEFGCNTIVGFNFGDGHTEADADAAAPAPGSAAAVR
jgi:hypothetical protein